MRVGSTPTADSYMLSHLSAIQRYTYRQTRISRLAPPLFDGWGVPQYTHTHSSTWPLYFQDNIYKAFLLQCISPIISILIYRWIIICPTRSVPWQIHLHPLTQIDFTYDQLILQINGDDLEFWYPKFQVMHTPILITCTINGFSNLFFWDYVPCIIFYKIF